MRWLATWIVVFLAPAPLVSIAQSPSTATPKTVLVTGASTGIGRKITEHLWSRCSMRRWLGRGRRLSNGRPLLADGRGLTSASPGRRGSSRCDHLPEELVG